MAGRDVQKPYKFLPRLEEAAAFPGFRQNFPSVAHIWHTDAEELERTKLSGPRQKLLQRAAQQAREVDEADLDAGATPSLPSSAPAPNTEAAAAAADKELLDYLDLWKQEGREALCQEFEGSLRESFSWPAAERRKMVEVHRQKWKALEDAIGQMAEAVRLASAEMPAVREKKAQSALDRVRLARDAMLKVQVKTLREVRRQLWPSPAGVTPGIATDAEELGIYNQLSGQVAAWQEAPKAQKAQPDSESEDERPLPVKSRAEMETQTPVDIAADALPLSLSVRPQPQGLPDLPDLPLVREALDADFSPSLEIPEGVLEDGLGDIYAGMDEKERAALAAIVKEQDELAEQKAESERALKQQELKLREADTAFQDQVGRLKAEAFETELKMKKKADDELRQKDKEHQAALLAERERFAKERYKLRSKLMGEQLVIETRKLKDELIRLKRLRPMRKEALKVLWWTEEDVNRVAGGKQLLIRRASGASSKSENMCAFAIGTARDWLFRSRELIEARSFAPSGKTIDGAAAMAGERETKLKAQFSAAVDSVGKFKARMKLLSERMLPDESSRSKVERRLEPQPESVAAGLTVERELAKGVRDAVAERLRDAEAKLDKLAEEDLAVDFLTRWSEQISAVGLKGMQTQRQSKDLAERIEDALRKEASKYRKTAQAAYAEIAADRAAEEATKKAEEAHKREAVREAARKKGLEEAVRREQDKVTQEKEKMVPVKLKVSGLRSSAIDDKAKFGQLAEQKVAKALALSNAQVRVTGIR
ncbi:unnamed protein product [Effrenium voratum]|nr:unnamed protein product [Effrenium voratum]